MDQFQTALLEQLKAINKTLNSIACIQDVKLAPDLPARLSSVAHCLDRRDDLVLADCKSGLFTQVQYGQGQRLFLLTPTQVCRALEQHDEGATP